MLNDFHEGVCGGHLSGLSTTQKKICEQVNFGRPYLKIALMWSRGATLAKCLHVI